MVYRSILIIINPDGSLSPAVDKSVSSFDVHDITDWIDILWQDIYKNANVRKPDSIVDPYFRGDFIYKETLYPEILYN